MSFRLKEEIRIKVVAGRVEIGPALRTITLPNALQICGVGSLLAELREIQSLASLQARGYELALIEELLAFLREANYLDEKFPPIPFSTRYNAASRSIELGQVTPESSGDLATQTFLERFLVESAAMSLAHRHRDGGRSSVTRRQEFPLIIFGAGRLLYGLLGSLYASGYSKISVKHRMRSDHPTQKIQPRDLFGSFLDSRDLLRSRGEVIDEISRFTRLFPKSAQEPKNYEIAQPGLIISLGYPAPDAVQRWLSEGTPHLFITPLSSEMIRIGPLVIPGKTPCFFCLYQEMEPELLHQFIDANVALTNIAIGIATADLHQFLETDKSVFHATTLDYSSTDFTEPKIRHWLRRPHCGCTIT
jgi:hypothetical protein